MTKQTSAMQRPHCTKRSPNRNKTRKDSKGSFTGNARKRLTWFGRQRKGGFTAAGRTRVDHDGALPIGGGRSLLITHVFTRPASHVGRARPRTRCRIRGHFPARAARG